jgi:hypothetical protein
MQLLDAYTGHGARAPAPRADDPGHQRVDDDRVLNRLALVGRARRRPTRDEPLAQMPIIGPAHATRVYQRAFSSVRERFHTSKT